MLKNGKISVFNNWVNIAITRNRSAVCIDFNHLCSKRKHSILVKNYGSGVFEVFRDSALQPITNHTSNTI